MNVTPRKNDLDFQESDMSITDVENSPFITVRDYQTKLTKLSNDNFTLKLLLFGLQKEFRMFLKSKNIQEDIIDLITNQQKSISTLTAEIGENSDFINSAQNNNIPPQSPSLKQQLSMALDNNLQLMNELKEKEQQQYDNVVESSILFDDGAQASIKNLELNNKNKELSKENEILRQKNDALANEIEEYQKENNDLLQKVANLTHSLKNQQDADDLADAQDKIDELESKNSQLEKDINDAASQLDDISVKNNKLMHENMKLKDDNNKLSEELADQVELTEQLKNANDNLNIGNSKLMRSLNVNYFDDILPKFNDLMKENSDLQNLNNQLNDQIAKLSNNNSSTSELKEQIYQLKAEIQKLQLQLQHQKDLKKDDYDELVAKNHNLKSKKQTIQSSINRLSPGKSSAISTSFSPKQSLQSSTANIDSLWNEAKNENDKLTKDIDELYNLLNEKLYSKINALSNENAKIRSIQKENDELKNQNDSLIRDLNSLQNENLALAQQIEIFKAENEDLSNENDSLRKQPRFNTMATTPIRFTLNTDQNNASIIEDLQNQIKVLQAENAALNLEKASPTKRRNNQQNNEIQELRDSLRKEEKMRQELTKYMFEVLNIVDDKINAFIDNFEKCFKRMSNNFHRFISIILTLTRSINSGNRQQVQELAQFGGSIISDMKRGAHICLSNCKGIKLDSVNPPLISREDRKKLTQLQKKWDTPVVGDLARFIREENERSMLINDPSLRNQKDALDFGKIIEQLQIVIHCIWKELGDGQNEPQISSLLQWKVSGDSIIQDTVNLIIEKVKKFKELISQQKKIIGFGSDSALSPQVVNLIQLVRREVSRLSKQMAEEYQGLIDFTQKE